MSQGYRRRAKKKVDEAGLLRETEGRSGEGLFQIGECSGRREWPIASEAAGRPGGARAVDPLLSANTYQVLGVPDAVLGQSAKGKCPSQLLPPSLSLQGVWDQSTLTVLFMPRHRVKAAISNAVSSLTPGFL